MARSIRPPLIAACCTVLALLWSTPPWAADAGPPAKTGPKPGPKPRAALGHKQASFQVIINPRKDSGHPWHGPGDLFVLGGKMVTHLPEAPGAVLCIVTQDGKASCPGQREDTSINVVPPSTPDKPKSAIPGRDKLPGLKSKKPVSPCPSAYDCEFDDITLPDDEVFGVVVIDPALAFINLVDAVIVTRRPMTKKTPEVLAFDPQLRDAVNALAPPGPFEAKRRQRQFQVRTLDECRQGCKFTQSEITIDID